MEPIRLWRWQNRMGVTGATTWHDVQHDPSMAEYAALPRADFDALVKELDAATARAERAERERDEARALLRAAADSVDRDRPDADVSLTDAARENLAARIDAALRVAT